MAAGHAAQPLRPWNCRRRRPLLGRVARGSSAELPQPGPPLGALAAGPRARRALETHHRQAPR
eukprot:5226893-Lingulodinium_polyedra.AAC.1